MVKSVPNRCNLQPLSFILSSLLGANYKSMSNERRLRVASNAITPAQLSLEFPTTVFVHGPSNDFFQVMFQDSDIKGSILFPGRLERDSVADGGGEEDAYLGRLPDPHEVAADQVRGEVAQKDPQEDQEQGTA